MLKLQKKFLHMKKFKMLAFQRYKIFHSNSRNDKDMLKWKKRVYGWQYYFWLGVYIVKNKKVHPLWDFFCFDHIFVIPWVWVENLISFESWIVNLFMVWKFFCILKIFWVMIFWTKIVYFFTITKNIISQVRIKKKIFCEIS